MATELIATQSELSTLVTALRRGDGGDHVRVLNGWRRELVGHENCGGITPTTVVGRPSTVMGRPTMPASAS